MTKSFLEFRNSLKIKATRNLLFYHQTWNNGFRRGVMMTRSTIKFVVRPNGKGKREKLNVDVTAHQYMK